VLRINIQLFVPILGACFFIGAAFVGFILDSLDKMQSLFEK
jgi:hypothetical protein